MLSLRLLARKEAIPWGLLMLESSKRTHNLREKAAFQAVQQALYKATFHIHFEHESVFYMDLDASKASGFVAIVYHVKGDFTGPFPDRRYLTSNIFLDRLYRLFLVLGACMQGTTCTLPLRSSLHVYAVLKWLQCLQYPIRYHPRKLYLDFSPNENGTTILDKSLSPFLYHQYVPPPSRRPLTDSRHPME